MELQLRISLIRVEIEFEKVAIRALLQVALLYLVRFGELLLLFNSELSVFQNLDS